MSIRLRLTLFYSAILVLTLLVFGTMLYFVQADFTYASIKRDLSANSDRVVQSINRALQRIPPSSSTNPSRPNFIPIPAELLGESTFRDLRVRDAVNVLNPDGSLVMSPFTRTGDALPISTEGLASIQQGYQVWETGTLEGEKLLISNTPILMNGQPVLIVQAARPLTDRDRSLESLIQYLVVAGIITTLVAFGAGWLLARFALKPIQSITSTAQAIGSERDFSKRVTHRGPNDEVGQLAKTFNTMLNQLEDAYQKMARALNLQRDFVADVSHELRTPLTTVRGNLALLLKNPPIPAGEQAEIVGDMVDESDRLIRLVNDLLTLARADAGRSFNVEPVSVCSVLEDVVAQAHQLDPQRQITADCPPGALINGDRDATKQILLILVDNALKHSSGEIKINVAETSGSVAVSVADQGEGIPPERLERIFDRFYRADEARSTPGFGLGLPIAKALTEGQMGSISVDSAAGKGSVFTFTLPKA